MLSDRTLEFGECVTRALLGLDGFIRKEPEGETFAPVLINLLPGRLNPEIFSSYEDARTRFQELERQVSELSEADRRLYYRQYCQSVLALIRLRTEGLSLQEQIGGFLHLPPVPPSEADLNALREILFARLNRMGYNGDLKAQATAWQERNRVPRDEVAAVLQDLLDEGWRRAAERFELPDAPEDRMRVRTVTGAHFNARCDYATRTVEINVDPVLNRPWLKHLVVHEAYPGHYVHFTLRLQGYLRGTSPADGLLSTVKSASSCTFEGIGDNGLRVLDWIEDDNDRVGELLTRLRAGLGAAAAWRLHALQWPRERVIDWLNEQALVGGEGWVSNRMAYISAPGRGAHIWSYWHGEPCVAAAWNGTSPEKRGEFLSYLYGRQHSPQTVAMFLPNQGQD